MCIASYKSVYFRICYDSFMYLISIKCIVSYEGYIVSVPVELIFWQFILRFIVVCLTSVFAHINFLSSIDLRVVIICCSISCWLYDIMRLSNGCCRFARLAVILTRFTNAFASFNSCSCNFAIWFSIWLSCLVNSFSIFCTLSLSMSSYDLSWYCMTLGTNGPTDTEISATTARVISRVSRLSVWMSVTFPCVVQLLGRKQALAYAIAGLSP